MADDYDDFFNESSDEEYCDDIDEDLDVMTATRRSLNINNHYVAKWTIADAFREFYQNLVDGIIETHSITRKDIMYFPQPETPKEIVILLRHQVTDKLLGFIRLDKMKGLVQMTNFDSRLTPRFLEQGGHKTNNKILAGAHGEGAKLGALVLVKAGYQVKYESASFYWNFILGGTNKRMLYCNVTAPKETKLQREKEVRRHEHPDHKRHNLKPKIWEDVTLQFGHIRGRYGKRIEITDFKNWLKVGIDLCRPSTIIETSYGSLILDEEFRGRIYLKGLFLETAKRCRYSYDFAHGYVNRDRERVADKDEEAVTMANIWRKAIKSDEINKKNDILSKYAELLLHYEESRWSDVAGAENSLTEQITRAIWKHLTTRNPNIFYHGLENAIQDSEHIQKNLKKVPKRVPQALWVPFRNYGFARTPVEHSRYLLSNAPKSTHRQTVYSESFQRVLGAILEIDPRTKHLDVVYKAGEDIHCDILIEDSRILINDKWLDFEASHDASFCSASEVAGSKSSNVFSCDHIATDLHTTILLELNKDNEISSLAHNSQMTKLKLRVSRALRQMPRLVKLKQGASPRQLDVSWRDFESQIMFEGHGLKLVCQVTLHRETTCAARNKNLVGPIVIQEHVSPFGLINETTISKQTRMEDCGCPSKLVLQKENIASFHSLEHNESYFAVVTPTTSQAFIGISVTSMKPEIERQISDANSNQGTGNPNEREHSIPSEYSFDTNHEDDERDVEHPDYQQYSIPEHTEDSGISATRLPKTSPVVLSSFTDQLTPQSIVPAVRFHLAGQPEQPSQPIQTPIEQEKYARSEIESLKASLEKVKASNDDLRTKIRIQKLVIGETQRKVDDLEERFGKFEKNIGLLSGHSTDNSNNANQQLGNNVVRETNSWTNVNAQARRERSFTTHNQHTSRPALSDATQKRVRSTEADGSDARASGSGAKRLRQGSPNEAKNTNIPGTSISLKPNSVCEIHIFWSGIHSKV